MSATGSRAAARREARKWQSTRSAQTRLRGRSARGCQRGGASCRTLATRTGRRQSPRAWYSWSSRRRPSHPEQEGARLVVRERRAGEEAAYAGGEHRVCCRRRGAAGRLAFATEDALVAVRSEQASEPVAADRGDALGADDRGGRALAPVLAARVRRGGPVGDALRARKRWVRLLLSSACAPQRARRPPPERAPPLETPWPPRRPSRRRPTRRTRDGVTEWARKMPARRMPGARRRGGLLRRKLCHGDVDVLDAARLWARESTRRLSETVEGMITILACARAPWLRGAKATPTRR